MRRWKVDTHSKLDSVLMLSSVNLPGGELVRNLCRNVSLCVRKQTIWVSGQVRHKPAQLICGFVFTYADCWFSDAVAYVSCVKHIFKRLSFCNHGITPSIKYL